MTKLKKILIATLIFIVTILFGLNLNVKAVDLNLTENTSNSNTMINTSDEEDYLASNYANSSSNANTNPISTTPSATVKTTSSTESGLGLTNILNIFLISIGILLILLAIAILIRLKN